ncbi:MAG: LPS export ABC transporter ATP-binding protein [Bdellovibrionota bacterium]
MTELNTLKAESLVKTYNKRNVVDGVSIEVKKGQVVGLLGPNGAGKTTVFYMIVGLVFPSEGKIYLGEEEITSKHLFERARLGVGYLPQEPSLFRKLSVYQNIAMALEAQKLKEDALKNRADELIATFGLEKVQHSSAAALSGGERRRCEIARCLAINPDFILLDEPFAGIDPKAVLEIQKIILELRQKNIGILITDHNVRETLGSCDYAYLMNQGRVFLSGSPQAITESSEAREIYLGEGFRL